MATKSCRPSRFLLGALGITVCALSCYRLAGEQLRVELVGRVIEQHSSTPLKQAHVVLLCLSENGSVLSAETGADGVFRVVLSASARYRIEVSKPNYASSVVFVTTESDQSVVIHLAKNGNISGRIIADTGSPAQEAVVFPLSRLSPGTSAFGMRNVGGGAAVPVDDRGAYRLSGLVPGDYQVAVAFSGAATTSGSGGAMLSEAGGPGILTILGGEEHRDLDLTIPPAKAHAIEGQLQPITEDGFFGATLTLQDQPSIVVGQTRVGKTGTFRFDRVRPGSYSILASGPTRMNVNGGVGGPLDRGPLFGRSDISLEFEDLRSVTVQMHRGYAVAFRLAAGAPPGGGAPCASRAVLHLSELDGRGGRTDREVEVDTGAPYIVTDMAPIRYSVGLTGLPPSCYYAGDSLLDMRYGAPEKVPLAIGYRAGIEGRLPIDDRNGQADYAVAWPIQPHVDEPTAFVMIPTAEGRFYSANLLPGDYRVSVMSSSDWGSSPPPANPHQTVTLHLEPGTASVVAIPSGH